MKDKLSSQIRRLFIVFAIFAIASILLKYSYIYVYPFIIAALISSFFQPLISKLEHTWHLHRGITAFFTILVFFVSALLLCYFIVKQLIVELYSFAEDFSVYLRNVNIFLEEIGQVYITRLKIFSNNIPWDPNILIAFIDEKAGEIISQSITSTMKASTLVVSSFTYSVTIIIVVIIATFFMIKDASLLIKIYEQTTPISVQRSFKKIIHYMKISFIGILKTHVLLALVSTTICFIGFFFLRVEHIFILTLAIFLLELIPYIGMGIIFIPWISYHFFTQNYLLTIGLIILYMSVIILRQLIEPKFLAKNLGIHPLVTLFILFIGLQLFGLFGFLITPIMLIILSSFYRANIIHSISTYIQNG